MTVVEQVRIPVGVDVLAATLVRSADTTLESPAGRPCVVMAHGVGATRDSGLLGIADALARSGADVLAFDYRNFAESTGTPRQSVALNGQRVDYHAAIAYARTLIGIDPGRIVAWGVSLSGGHVIRVAAEDHRLAAMISLTPAVDGLAVVGRMLAVHGGGYVARLAVLGIRDAVGARRRGDAVLVPVVGRPGDTAALCAPGALEGMLAIAGPTWRNAIAARLGVQIATFRPIDRAGQVDCPVLVQIGDNDQTAPPGPATKAATRMRATVHHYPCDHFDVYPGGPWFDRVIADQVAFLRRILR